MILFLILLVLLAVVLQQKIGHVALQSLAVGLETDRKLVDPGEKTNLTVWAENRGRFPVLFLMIRVSLPEGTDVEDETASISQHLRIIRYQFSCYLLPGQRIERRTVISFPCRGVWNLGGVQLAAGDLLGMKEDYESRAVTLPVVVAPRRLEEMESVPVSGGLMGDRSVRRWIHEDPILSAGYREYTGRDPQRAIAWTRSLVSGKMMVRQYDHTTDQRVRVLLVLQGETDSRELGSWQADPDKTETAFSAARTICEDLERENIPYSFASNGELYSFLGTMDRVGSGLGRNHLGQILEGLGRAGYGLRLNPEELIRRELWSADSVQGYLLIVLRQDDRIRQLMEQLRFRTGAEVMIWEGGERTDETAGNYDMLRS